MRLLMTAAQVAADQTGWKDARRAGIGGSDIGTIMRLDGHHGSPYRLWAEKTGRWTRPPVEDRRLAFGNYCENFIAWCLATDRPGMHLTPGGLYAHDSRPWQLATFDRLGHDVKTCGGDGCAATAPRYNVQMKTDAGFRNWRRDGMPETYLAQCVWEGDLAGTEIALLPVFNRVEADVTDILRVTMDAEANRYMEALLEGAEAFWELVTSDTPPPMDGSRATTETLRQMYPGVDRDRSVRLPARLAARWRRASKAAKAAEERRLKYLNMLMVKAAGPDGVLAGVWTVANPDGGDDIKVASVSAGPRAGYETKPKDHVTSVQPNRKWQP